MGTEKNSLDSTTITGHKDFSKPRFLTLLQLLKIAPEKRTWAEKQFITMHTGLHQDKNGPLVTTKY